MSFKDAVALIKFALPGGGEVRGTGFLVTERYALTALHVVAERRASTARVGQAQPAVYASPIPLRFTDAQRTARVVDGLWDPYEDWALLELDRATDVEPIGLGTIDGDRASVKWRSYGFPDTKPDGMMVEGRVRDASGRIQGIPALQLFSEEAASGEGMPIRGLSGAPCIACGRAVGILRWVPMANRSTGQAHAGTVFACPMSLIAARCGDLLPPAIPVSHRSARSMGAISLPGPATVPRRVRVALVGLVGLVVVLAAGLAVAYLGRDDPAPRRDEGTLYVAVQAPKVQSSSGIGEVELIAAAVRQAVLRGLTHLDGLVPIAESDVDVADADARTLRDLARALAVDEVITSRLFCTAGTCDVALSWVRSDGGVRRTESFEIAPPRDYRRSLAIIASQVQQGYDDRAARGGVPELTVSNADYERYLRLEREFARMDMSTDQILAGLDAIRESSPGFVDAYLFAAEILRKRFFSDTRDAADIAGARRLVAAAEKLAPEQSTVLHTKFNVAWAASDLDQAEQVLAELQRRDPDNAENLVLAGNLEKSRGNTARAIELFRLAVTKRPSWQTLFNLAQLELKNGQLAAAREHVTELLARAPDNYYAQSLEAKMELKDGNLSRAAALYGDLAARSGRYVPYTNLGFAQLLLGRFEAALGNFERAAELRPKNAHALLNLGEAQQLAGRPDEAHDTYRRALELMDADPGAADANWIARRAVLLAHLQRAAEATQNIEQALAKGPDDRDVVYLAVHAYALVGDLERARQTAVEALELGYGAVWFRYPWLDGVRSDAGLARRLADAAPDAAR